ncbi:hypothetical protein LPJ56_007170, partial [Coemansia sp. RSA 2599]
MAESKPENGISVSVSDVSEKNTASSSIKQSDSIAKEALQDIESGKNESVDDSGQPIKGKKLIAVLVALAMSMFLGALDNTIVSTMMPKISEKFSAAMLVTWIFSAYV